MDLLSCDPQTDYPALCALVTAFKLAHVEDESAFRAADGAIRMLRAPVALAFDGVELRVLSERAEDGTEYVTDGESCTCKAKSHPWCKHRVIFRQLLALAALRSPGLLRVAIAEQTVPPADAPALATGRAERGQPPAPWDLDPDYLTYTPRYDAQPPADRRALRERRAREMEELFAA